MKSIKNISISTITIIVLALLILFPLTAYAAPVGNVSHVTGRVDITSPGEAAMPANVGDEVNENDIIRTKSKSKAEITFLDGNVLRLAEETRVEIAEYMIEEEQVTGVLNLFRGKLQNIVSTLGKKFGHNKRDRFEVHTPTAVCGVRGTNFFPWYLKGVSGATFQKGEGYLYSKGRPDNIKTIRAGQTGLVVNADQPPKVRPATDKEMGEHVDDTFPSDDEGEGEGEGEGEAGTPEGYEPPEDEGLGDLGGDDTGDTGFDLGLNTGPYIPPDIGGGDDGGDDGPTTTYTTFSDPISFDFLIGDEAATLSGSINDFTDEGTLNLSGNASDFPVDTWEDDFSATLSDESALEGYFLGISGTWEGLLTSIYVTDDEDAGYIYGDLSGDYDSVDETFSGSGSITRGSILGDAGITPDALADALGSESEANYVLFNMEIPVFNYIEIEGGQPSVFSEPTSPEFDEIMGISTTGGRILGIWQNTEESGSYSNLSDEGHPDGYQEWGGAYGYSDDYGEYYMLGDDISGTDDLEGHVTITGNLTYLDTEYLGSIDLEYRGTYFDEEDSRGYQSIGAGTYTLDPLAFVSDFETYEIDNLNVFSARGGYYAYLEGLMGGTQSLWDGSADVTIVGKYDDSFDINPSHIWYWDDIYSYNYDISSPNYETYTTYDGGAYYGFTGGIELDNKLEGMFLALYIDPNSKIEGGTTYYPAGYLSGDLAGTAYPDDIQMFEMGGILNTNPVTEIDMIPSDLENSLYWGEMEDCYLGGSFNGADSLVGQNDYIYYLPSYYGYSMAYTLSIEGQPWGIYGFTLGGDTSGKIPTNWEAAIGYRAYWGSYDYGEDEGYWLATIDGTDWSDGRLAGELAGKAVGYYYLYEISGNVLGTYNNTDDTWQAVSLGTYTGKPLTFWSEFDPSLYFYDSVTGFNQDGDFTGFMGGIESLWDESAEVTIIGEYNNDVSSPSHIWYYDDIYSYNYKEDTDTTYDDPPGAYCGFTGGIELNNELKGMFLALYIDPLGNAGYLSGNLTGTTYPDIYPDDPWGMFEAGGRIYPVQMETGIGIPPGDLLGDIGEGDIFFTGNGDFFDNAIDIGDIVVAVSEGYSASISDQDWGIWTTMLGGTYADSTSDWSLHLSSQNEGSDHWAEVVDTDWSTEGEIAGKVAGAWVNLDDAMTSVMGGELIGTFNPTNDTWQAVAAGSWIETNRFLGMAAVQLDGDGNPLLDGDGNTIPANPDQIAMLNQLNIPCIEIGRTNLSGGNLDMTVKMNDVTFFAYSTNDAPKIWATSDVNGTYNTLNPAPVTNLTGDNVGGFGGSFIMNPMIEISTGSNTGNWDASVSGSGIISTIAVTMEGAAAGDFGGTAETTSGNFNGTGAGVATPTPTSPQNLTIEQP